MASNIEEFSGSDSDTGLDEDMEALRRACLLTGTSTNDVAEPSSAATTSSAPPQSDGDCTTASYDGSEEDDDLELVRRIQQRFSTCSTADMDQTLTLKPLCSLAPAAGSDNDDYEEDFETLRAIQRRFSQYNDSVNSSRASSFQKHEQVGATNIDSGKERSNSLFVQRTNNGEEFPDCIDASATTTNLDSSGSMVLEALPSYLIQWHEHGAGGEVVAALPIGDSSFPKSAQAFVDTIKKNRSCQKFMRNKLIQIEARIEENRKLRSRIKLLKDFQVACRKRTGRALSQKKDARIQLISVPKPRANSKVNEKKLPAICHGPAENSQVANYRMALAKSALSLTREKWSKEEKENLAKGIKQQFQEMLLQKSMDLFSAADGDSNDFDSMITSVRDHEITPENIRLFLPKVNWEQLASMYIMGRSGAECEARWLNCEDPLINRQPWTKLEDKNLLHLIQQRGINNWIDIAVSLGTNRTPFQCLARYQRSLNASIMKREWTEDEDNELRAAVAALGESNWQLIASRLEGRTGTQCSNRWKKSLNPIRQRVGRWEPDEDKRLKISVMLFGAKAWNKIANFVPGRTQVQCRERWVNCLDPSLNLNEWTEEEDSRLKTAIAEHGYSWSKVAACVHPRTDSQCRRRWKLLLPHEVPLLQAAKKMQKVALISNFVDRESERPALGASDFVPLPMIESVPEAKEVNHSSKKIRKLRNLPEEENTFAERDSLSQQKRVRTCLGENEGSEPTCSEVAEVEIQEDIVISEPNEVEALGVDGSSSLENSRKKKLHNKNKGSDQTQCHSSSCVYSTPLMEIGETEAVKRNSIANKSRVRKPCSNRKSPGISTDGQSLSSLHPSLEMTPAENVEAFGADITTPFVERNPRCPTPIIMDSCNPRASRGLKPNSPQKLSTRGGTCSKPRMEAKDEDDMTLASFIQKLGNHRGGSSTKIVKGSQSTLLPPGCIPSDDVPENLNSSLSVACFQSMPKRSRARKRTISGQTLGTQDEDGETLASFQSELRKKRRQLDKHC